MWRRAKSVLGSGRGTLTPVPRVLLVDDLVFVLVDRFGRHQASPTSKFSRPFSVDS